MTDDAQDFRKQFDIFARQTAAEVASTRTILQCLLVSMFGQHPEGTKLVSGLRDNALANLAHAADAASSTQDVARFHEATQQQVDRFFEDMRPVFPKMPSGAESQN
jgi:hypothetical protein